MPSIKGTASVADDRAISKLLRSTRFPPNFSKKVDQTRVHREVLSQWIEDRIQELLGFEDDIVASTAVNLFLPPVPEDGARPAVDPRRAQLDLVGFLGEGDAAAFASELWTLLIDAQTGTGGIPRRLLEAKKAEMAKEAAAKERNVVSAGRIQVGGGISMGKGGDVGRMVAEARRRAEAARGALAMQKVHEGASASLPAAAPLPLAEVVAPPFVLDRKPDVVPEDDEENISAKSDIERKGPVQRRDRKDDSRHRDAERGRNDRDYEYRWRHDDSRGDRDRYDDRRREGYGANPGGHRASSDNDRKSGRDYRNYDDRDYGGRDDYGRRREGERGRRSKSRSYDGGRRRRGNRDSRRRSRSRSYDRDDRRDSRRYHDRRRSRSRSVGSSERRRPRSYHRYSRSRSRSRDHSRSRSASLRSTSRSASRTSSRSQSHDRSGGKKSKGGSRRRGVSEGR